MVGTQPNNHVLNNLVTHDLHLACYQCIQYIDYITFSLKREKHQCKSELLLARQKGQSKWKRVHQKPKSPVPLKYEVCCFIKPGQGCTKHMKKCTFATSEEEASVWNFQKKYGLDYNTLVHLVKEKPQPTEARSLFQQCGVAAKLQAYCNGQFMELCEGCFFGSPQQIVMKGLGPFCNSRSRHVWKPILVLHKYIGSGIVAFHDIRPMPSLTTLQCCMYVLSGQPCRHGRWRCRFAHSDAELVVWKAELQEGLNRSDLLRGPPRIEARASASEPHADHFYCKFCKVTYSTQQSFRNHCASLDHTRKIREDQMTQWKCRPPPANQTDGFVLCYRPSTCEYGQNCVAAHSKEELQEWILRNKSAQKMKRLAQQEGLLSYQDQLLMEYKNSSNEVHIMSENIPGIRVSSDTDLNIHCKEDCMELKWVFHIESETPLLHIALLKQDPGAVFTLGENNPDSPCTYGIGAQYYKAELTFDIPVSFKSVTSGFYEQWVVFDFDTRPVLLKKIQVRVGKQSFTQPKGAPESRPQFQRLERWHRGNRTIIPCLEKTEAEEDLLKEYKPPQLNLQFRPEAEGSVPITQDNYKERMHSFLYREELAQEEVLKRMSLQATMTIFDEVEKKHGKDGEFCAKVPVCQYALTPDTNEGYVLRNAVHSALLAPFPQSDKKVYEAIMLWQLCGEGEFYLELSGRCCSDLGLQKNSEHQMEVQFQLNRLQFCEWHQAVDLLPSVSIVLPDLTTCSVPAHNGEFLKLNAKQKAAMAFIIGEADGRGPVPPLLIYGPFGTGKTFTLAAAAIELVRQPDTRVLICTHTNSSADIYVKDYFHTRVNTMHTVPLRIKSNRKGAGVTATDRITLNYCNLSEDGQSFKFPDKMTLDLSRIVITTTTMARRFHGLLSPGYFTHILIDEASQMLECAALMPLGLAGKGTRVVLAGDHMQMGPKLFSVENGQHSDYTLLNRLFHFYQGEKHEIASKSRIIFNENYRSTKEIVDFVSTYFYVGKSDAIKAMGNIPPHPQFHPLKFHHVRGTCKLDTTTMSWSNEEEIVEVVQIVQNILRNWPCKKDQWGDRSQREVCVLSEGKKQVDSIRQALRNKHLGKVTVENVSNIQGKQFRVVVMTAVQTRDSLLSSNTSTLEFFSEARVLNTAMTRAQSQVIVVGDATALCYFGKCSKIWKSYIQQCIEKGSAHPQSLDMDHVDQEVREIARFTRGREENDSDTESVTSEMTDISDPILQELLDESKDIRVTVTNEGLLDVFPNDCFTEDRPFEEHEEEPLADYTEPALEALLRDNPRVYKHCELILERFDSGYARPLDQPTLHINIRGRKNVGRSFPGDQVLVEILSNENCLSCGKVLGVLKMADRSRVFVCTMENYDKQVMTPINRCVSKIFTPCLKKSPNCIAVQKYEHGRWVIEKRVRINEETKRNYLFVVKVLVWRKKFIYPLGVVTNIIPKVTSLEDGLQVLDIEYELKRNRPQSVQEELVRYKQIKLERESRTNLCEHTTFTIDPWASRDLDDAISVRDLGKQFEIGVHISDVASFVPKGCAIDKDAMQRGTTYYPPETEPVHMFPRSLSVGHFSLLPNNERQAISLMVVVEKETDRIIESRFVLSLIKSDRKMSYEEAEKIIQDYCGDQYKFDTLEDCLAVAYRFSMVHRKNRMLGDWCYETLDEDMYPGERRSHEMVKELMIMFNSSVAEYLITNNVTENVTPLRCQNPPYPDQLCQFKRKYSSLIPLSVHLSYHIKGNTACDHKITELKPKQKVIDQTELPEPEIKVCPDFTFDRNENIFCILTSLWKELESAAQNREFHKIRDLIATDDIHPQLLPLLLEFQKLLSKAYIIRSNSTLQSKVGHYDMQLNSYTWASSPIRRYMDVVVQRHLHTVLRNKAIQYTNQELDLFCAEFSQKHEKQGAYSRTVEKLNLASQLNSQSRQKLAFVVDVFPTGKCFMVSFPLNRDYLPRTNPIFFRDLQLVDQPLYNEQSQCVTLKWSRRVYSMANENIHKEIKQHYPSQVTALQIAVWQQIVSALRVEDWNKVLKLLEEINSEVFNGNRDKPAQLNRDSETMTINGSEYEMEHYVELSLSLKAGGTVQVQMSTDTIRGMLVPAVQLLIIHPKFEVCLDHTKDPIMCFSKYAVHASKQNYIDYMEYQKIWWPLCEMESASNAVVENDSIIFEDTEIKWNRKHREGFHQGSFQLSLDQKKLWSIECDLSKCFLCIRMRQQNPNPREHRIEEDTLGQRKLSSQVDPTFFTWVAHGITTNITDEEESKKLSYIQIDFDINHVSMKTIPDSVFKMDSKFTVELVAKLLPDARKEDAITQLRRANELVKNIALGKTIRQNTVFPRYRNFEIKNHVMLGLPPLNESQNKAIGKSLETQFTLIQGPPGTGKTVVGVHIVYWFFSQNKNMRSTKKSKECDGMPMKKDCILYCGPSNKSVDVVAEYLLRFNNELRPLRVYSDQMEMLEFPYPGSNLKLSRKSLREEKPKHELRSISLHHLIRMDGKPFSDEIKRFDTRIKRGEELTDEEVVNYKKMLNMARQDELVNHDVILCTCTAASNPNFSQKLNVQQILIDECAMATEPEALIPLVTHKPEKIVLLGDHKQLRPIVHNELLKRLGMRKSLFERYMKNALMLDTQYRMHEEICAFPSKEFYDDRLKTGAKRKASVLLAGQNRHSPILFGHVEGKEISLVVSTEKGNENSKANLEEAEVSVCVTKQLIRNAQIKAESIAILTPYNAQVSKINELLTKSGIQDVTVSTIVKSQDISLL
ncbi:3'-5' exoribonuclease HELZ2 isoform X2 [Amia ocellicauda]|uniref:3'-5' exoribonuclease HELZ2 isoform X2 n=1 Tax=Amia ocellicauda TaxID=2972642 RepID=UPI003463F57D